MITTNQRNKETIIIKASSLSSAFLNLRYKRASFLAGNDIDTDGVSPSVSECNREVKPDPYQFAR